jgi:hypothetical protein
LPRCLCLSRSLCRFAFLCASPCFHPWPCHNLHWNYAASDDSVCVTDDAMCRSFSSLKSSKLILEVDGSCCLLPLTQSSSTES